MGFTTGWCAGGGGGGGGGVGVDVVDGRSGLVNLTVDPTVPAGLSKLTFS